MTRQPCTALGTPGLHSTGAACCGPSTAWSVMVSPRPADSRATHQDAHAPAATHTHARTPGPVTCSWFTVFLLLLLQRHPNRPAPSNGQVSPRDGVDSAACGRQVWRRQRRRRRQQQRISHERRLAWSWHFSGERPERAAACGGESRLLLLVFTDICTSSREVGGRICSSAQFATVQCLLC